MGVFHQLYGAQRVTNLRIRLAEYCEWVCAPASSTNPEGAS